MSWLSSGVKKLGHIAAPIVHLGAEAAGGAGGFLMGGPAGAMAGWKVGDKLGNIGQDALSGANVRTHLGENLVGAAEAAAGGALASQLPSGGDSNFLSLLRLGAHGGGGPETTGLPPIYDEQGHSILNPGNAPSGGGFGGLVSKLGGGGGGIDLQTILQGLSGAEGAYNTLQSNKYRGKAIDLAKGQANAAAPLRTAANAKLLAPGTPDLSSVYQNAQNPFSTYRSVP